MSKIVTIENDKFIVKLFSLGAILNSFYVKSHDVDIVLGYNESDEYLKEGNAQMGKTIGRCANRIGNAEFTLNGKTYKLARNNGPNCLHSGVVSFGNVEWTLIKQEKSKAVFEYYSKNMESGFPGNVKVTTTYELCDCELKITYSAISDEDTIFNITNHSYFNLDKHKKNILSHKLKIDSTKVNLNDENGMASENVIDTNNTPFDFNDFKYISDNISDDGAELNTYCKNLLQNTGNNVSKQLIDNLDTNYLYENTDYKTLCILKNEIMKLEVKSDLPCVQIYTGKNLNVDGRDGHYSAYAGIAIEPQFCPNAINYKKFIKPVIKANEYISHTISYKVIDI